MGDSFAHLHVHTEYSMLDGAARIDDVVAAAVADGQPAIGITDHGNMYGVLPFYQAARKAGIVPVLGIEAYMAGESRFERPARRGRIDDGGGEGERGEKLYYHLTLLAASTQGYKNIIKLSSEAYLSGYFYKPRCLVPGQEIVTANGVVPIEDIRVGDRVLTHKGRLRRVTQTMSRPFDGKLYGVRLNNRYGRVTWMTGDHPVLVREQDGTKRWTDVQRIAAGRRGSGTDCMKSWRSFACLPKVRPDSRVERISTAAYVGGGWQPIPDDRWVKSSPRSKRGPTKHYSDLLHEVVLDYDFGFFLGLYAAEGCVDRNHAVTVSLHRDETHLIEAFQRTVKHLIGKHVVLNHRPDRPGYRGVDVTAYSGPLAHLLRSLCGTGTNGKRLPHFTFEADADFQRGILDGVLAGDGSEHPGVNIFRQTSRNLAWQVRMLAATFNDSFPNITEHWDGHPNHAVQYGSNISTGGAGVYRRTRSDDEYVYRPIAEILEREWQGTVYNIEVEDDHSYVSDFAIHNCDWELLERHREGVIATTGCLGGVICQALLRDDVEAATRAAGRLRDIFGPDHLYVELQDHGIADQIKANRHLIEIARHLDLPLLATNDSHYTHREDAVAHDALLCVQTGAQVDDPKRFKFEGSEHYLKSSAEMRALFAEVPEACDNTLRIAERVDVEIEFGKPELPRFTVPAGSTEDEYLRGLTFEGARRRYGTPVPDAVAERIDHELGVIHRMGLSAYFLVVWDLIHHARRKGIRVGPGRGSAAGCCVAYCLQIVDVDPIRYGLIFERFLNEGRREMPDIDMDFDERYRGEMIRYAAERYGSDHVAQIVTFSTIKARAAVRDAARVLGYPYAVGDKIAKAMPPLVMGRDTPLDACLELEHGHEEGYKMASELRALCDADADVKKVVDVARGLAGLRRQDGIHAAAVVITREPLTEYLPVQRKPEPGGDPADAPIVTQYEMNGVAALGLLKMDFLGLRNLTVIERALVLIETSAGRRVDIDNVDLEDERTFDMLRKGDSVGVFQLEGGPMRALMRSLAPTCFDDVAALVALYRPGPMAANMHNDFADRKNGRKPVKCLHPHLEEELADTHGLMIYQESMMRVASRFAGYSLEEADNLRKACGKKNRALLAMEREKFVDSCEANGYERTLGTGLFDLIEPFADYAFNKSHAYAYGMVAYQTAWLKANHPVEYLAALLTSVKDDKDRTAVYLSECRGMGIEVLVPDVNVSIAEFGVVTDGVTTTHGQTGTPGAAGKIPFGMSAIRNVGEGLVGLIVAERTQGGPYADFYDFCQRVDPGVLNKRSVESLIKAGAFDSLGHPRRALLAVFEGIIDHTLARRRDEELGIMSLFGEVAGPAPVHDERIPIGTDEFEQTQKLAFEKEMLGLYISSHPLLGVESILRRHTDCTIADLREQRDGETRWVGGVVTALSRKYTKRGDLMAVFTLEDLQSAIEVMVFPRTMLEHGVLLADDAIVCVKGRLDLREEPAKIVCLELKRPDLSPEGTAPVRINLPVGGLSHTLLGRLKSLLRDHPGAQPVHLHLERTVLRLPDEFRVDAGNGLVSELRVLLGPNGLVT